MCLLVNLIHVTWSRTRTQYAVLKISIESCLLDRPYVVCRLPWGRCLCSFVRWSTEHDTDRETQARRSSCSSCTPMIVARAVFAWFPAGYGKLSCYQLLAFVYDFKLKWTRSRGTERNVVCAIAPSSLRILTPYKPVHVHWWLIYGTVYGKILY